MFITCIYRNSVAYVSLSFFECIYGYSISCTRKNGGNAAEISMYVWDKRVLLWDIDEAFLNGIGSYL